MKLDRITLALVTCALAGGVAAWLGIMISAALSVPVFGFIAILPAVLVVYVVRQSLSGERIPNDGDEIIVK